MYCSIKQALGIWDELRSAYEGTNGFGSDTAEIYVYRLLSNDPNMLLGAKDYKRDPQDLKKASQCLGEIIDIFKEHYDKIKVEINGLEYKKWIKKHGHEFDHRVHIKIIKLKTK